MTVRVAMAMGQALAGLNHDEVATAIVQAVSQAAMTQGHDESWERTVLTRLDELGQERIISI